MVINSAWTVRIIEADTKIQSNETIAQRLMLMRRLRTLLILQVMKITVQRICIDREKKQIFPDKSIV